jgi:hypothetical protein
MTRANTHTELIQPVRPARRGDHEVPCSAVGVSSVCRVGNFMINKTGE